MATNTIIAIDLGRYKSVAYTYDRHSRDLSFRTIDTTPDELTKLLARHPNSLVVIDHRKRMEKNLHRRAKELDYDLHNIGSPTQPTAA